jgi:hypothetical protein
LSIRPKDGSFLAAPIFLLIDTRRCSERAPYPDPLFCNSREETVSVNERIHVFYIYTKIQLIVLKKHTSGLTKKSWMDMSGNAE